MKEQPPRFCFNTTKFPILGLLIALLYVLVAGSVMAAPPADKPCKGKKCETPLPESPENYVFWGVDEFSLIFENGYHTCSLAQLAADFSSGTYDCVLNDALVEYRFDFFGWEQIYERGEQWYCDHLDSLTIAPDQQYSYSWTGDCTTGCDVSIINRFQRPNSALYRSYTVETFVQGVTSTDPIPFTEAQNLSVDYIHVTKFAPKGKNKVLAICKFVPDPGTMTFHTSLDPVTPD